jgi:hypothetical protein
MLARWWGEFGLYDRPRRAFAILSVSIGFILRISNDSRVPSEPRLPS